MIGLHYYYYMKVTKGGLVIVSEILEFGDIKERVAPHVSYLLAQWMCNEVAIF